MRISLSLLSLLLVICCFVSTGISESFDSPGMGNPIVPGYYADPTVCKYGDTYYMYATTDGTAAGNGPSQVWVSKDFVNWTNLAMNWPNTKWIWAPDVNLGKDGKYYFYYSQPCEIYAGVSDTPIGPWTPLKPENDGMIVPNKYVPPVITLDWQTFLDEEGRRFAMFCTWAIYKGHGCGMVQVGDDMLPIDSTKGMIPNAQLPELFEGPFMILKDGVYYLMYSAGSCHDDTYCVHYATADNPMGPYHYDKATNPLLATNADGTIHGPGHHSIVQEGDDYYIVYHRHDNPQSNHGMHRQIAADKLVFGPNNTIEKVVPTHTGIGYLGENTNPYENLALTKDIKVSSYYDDRFKPAYAVDDNNGTLWKAKDNSLPQIIEVDLGQSQQVKRTWTEFQYPNWYYQYLIEYSQDGETWQIFSDKRNNKLSGSPMVDYGDIKCRYLRLTITGLEKPGMYVGLWNFKAFSGAKYDPPQELVHLEAADLADGSFEIWPNNMGMLGGNYTLTSGKAQVKVVDGHKAVYMEDSPECVYDGYIPETLRENGVYTEISHVYMPARDGSGMQWHYFAFVSDGANGSFYVDGELMGSRALEDKWDPFAFRLGRFGPNMPDMELGYGTVRIFARALHISEIKYIIENGYTPPAEPSPQPRGLLVDLDASELTLGNIDSWANNGLEGGEFSCENGSCSSELIGGVKAVSFKGRNSMSSSFSVPGSLKGNGNYTIAIWAYNPEVAETEFMVSFSDEGGLEGTSGRLGFGSSREFGAVVHGGWADLGYRNTPEAGKWQHIAITFDGSIEKIYVNGKLDNQEEKMLHLAGGESILLGRSHTRGEYFSGALASVKIYDKALSSNDIYALAEDEPASPVLISFDAAFENYHSTGVLENEGSLEGDFLGNCPVPDDINGKIAFAFDGSEKLEMDAAVQEESEFSIAVFVCCKSSEGGELLKLKHKNGDISTVCDLPGGDGSWQYIVVSGTDLYINGNKVAGGSGQSGLLAAGDVFLLGNGFKGGLYSLAVYDHHLTEAQVMELYKSATSDMEPPDICEFLVAPSAVTPDSIVMSAKPSGDISGQVQYYFELVSVGYGASSSNWQSETSFEVFGVAPDKEYVYYLKVCDSHGNIAITEKPGVAVTDSKQFDIYYDDFDITCDYLDQGTGGTIWDGIVTKGQGAMEVNSVKANGGSIHIESTGAIVDQAEGAPVIYRAVSGDFIAEAKVADIQGWSQRAMPGLLEPALIARVADLDNAGPGEDHIRLGIFPYWNCGNLWTSMDGRRRPQGFNSTGYRPDMYLQMQRSGDMFYLRTSRNGKNWKAVNGTPLHRPDLNGIALQVGLTQTINEKDLSGWVEFDWFKLTVKKK